MHTPCGHINHYWESVGAAIVKKMRGCEWQLRLGTVESKLETRIVATQNKIKETRASGVGQVSTRAANQKYDVVR